MIADRRRESPSSKLRLAKRLEESTASMQLPEEHSAPAPSRELAHERIGDLYEISKLLTRFESLERTIPTVLSVMARTLSLCSSICLVETKIPGKPRSILWRSEGQTANRMRMAKAHASGAYGYLVGGADIDLGSDASKPSREPPEEESWQRKRNYILLPLVVDKRPIFGAIHLEGRTPFDENDLVFANAVVNQVAIAVDRQAIVDARQQVAEIARTVAERKQTDAEAAHALAEQRRAAAERAEEAMRGEVAFARDVTGSLGEGVVAVDQNGRITLFNSAAEDLIGLRAEDAFGQLVADVVHIHRSDGSFISARECPFGIAMHRGAPFGSDDALFSSRSRTPFPVSYTCAPLRRAGEIAGAVLAFRDIMDVKLAEKRQRTLADVSATLVSAVEYRQTLSAIVRFAVPALADLCFIDELGDDGVAQRLEVVFADEQKQRAFADPVRRFAPRPGWKTAQSKVLESGISLLVADVGDPWLIAQEQEHAKIIDEAGNKSMMVVPLVARGKTFGALTFVMAESGRRYSWTDLNLANEIGHRAALALDNARLYEQAQQATRARDDLLAVVSHDLKNPLSVVLMSVVLMLQSAGPGDRRQSTRQLWSIKRSAERMDRLIRDLLDTASIEAGHFSVEPRRLLVAPLMTDALEALLPLAEKKSIRVTVDLGDEIPPVAADASRIQQVLANLLGNALKFTAKGGFILLRAARAGGAVVFSVSDTGPGIGEDDLAHLFDRFWQARRTARLGTGLGLFIVKGIVEAHGGRVWVESKVGVGTTFSFELPIAPPELAPESQPSLTPHSSKLLSEIDKHTHDVFELTREVEVRKRELRTALDSTGVARELAKQASGFRRDLVAVASHELRSPLAALELMVERLQRDPRTPPTSEQEEIIRRMFGAISRMAVTVESLQQHALIQSGQLTTEISPFDLRETAASVLADLRPHADAKGLELRLSAAPDLPALWSDRELVRVILENLVGNAIKFTPRGQVHLTLDTTLGRHRLIVRDQGPGIPVDERESVFEPFAKAAAARREHLPGLGLGLSLVREISHALGGEVRVDSTTGGGSTFTVSLPVSPRMLPAQMVLVH